MNENRLSSIQSGLMQYIGAIIKEIKKEDAASAHVALAKLSEAWLECCQDKDGYNIFIAKPILRACVIILDDYYRQVLKDIPDEIQPEIKNKLNDVLRAKKILNNFVDSIKGDNTHWK
nr:MAG TPA: hypothetical protein [Caudoviricetes sp.]